MEELQSELSETQGHFKDILDRGIASANMIAILYKQYGEPEQFDSIARQLMDFDRSIDLINITDKYVISHVYPLEGNEMILGKSILDVPMFKKELEIAIENKKVMFIGPYEMTNGRGTAIGARIPIFINDTFKGIVNVVTKMPRFFEQLPQFQNKNDRFVYQLSKEDPLTHRTEHFFPGYEPRNGDSISIYMPEGNWTLSVAYAKDYPSSNNAIVISLLGILLSIAVAFVVYTRMRRTVYLEQQVQASTRHLHERVKELTTIYKVSEILRDDTQSIESVFTRIVALLPGGWQFPGICAACISFDGQRYTSDNYSENKADEQTAPFVLQDGRSGSITVIYLKKMPAEAEGPFQKEERDLINALAEAIRIYFNKKIDQDALTHSEERFRSLVERSLVGVYIIQNDRFVYVNPKIIEESGYSEQELLSRPFIEFVIEEDKPTVLQHVISRLAGSDAAARYEVRIKRKGGQVLWTEMYGTTTLFEGKKALIGTMVNVTERKDLETEKQNIINKLLQRNKDLEEFNHILSHSVRAPLATILGLSGLIKDAQSDEDRLYTIEGIERSAKELDATISDLNKILHTKNS